MIIVVGVIIALCVVFGLIYLLNDLQAKEKQLLRQKNEIRRITQDVVKLQNWITERALDNDDVALNRIRIMANSINTAKAKKGLTNPK